MAISISGARILIESRMQDALAGDPAACFDIGIAYDGEANLVEAHRWFHRAAEGGYAPAEASRAKIARRMSAREMAEARRGTGGFHPAYARQAALLSASVFS